MLSKEDLKRLREAAATSPIQRQIDAVKSIEDLGHFLTTLRAERGDAVSGIDLDAYLEAFAAVCARVRENRQMRGDDITDSPQWRDFADLIYTALLYE